MWHLRLAKLEQSFFELLASVHSPLERSDELCGWPVALQQVKVIVPEFKKVYLFAFVLKPVRFLWFDFFFFFFLSSCQKLLRRTLVYLTWEQIFPVPLVKMKVTKWNLSLSREETSAILSWRTTSLFSNQSAQHWGQVAEIAFLSTKCLEGFFFFKTRKKKVVVLSIPVWKSNLCPHGGEVWGWGVVVEDF